MLATRPLIWVTKDSFEYKLFIDRLTSNIIIQSNRFVCLECWAFIYENEKQFHTEHESYIRPHAYYKDEATFLELAQRNKKVDGNQVAIFNNRCIFNNDPFQY